MKLLCIYTVRAVRQCHNVNLDPFSAVNFSIRGLNQNRQKHLRTCERNSSRASMLCVLSALTVCYCRLGLSFFAQTRQNVDWKTFGQFVDV